MRTWPPGVSWYRQLSAHATRSGHRVGTVAASRPPGRSATRDLRQRALVVPDVLEHLGDDDAIEGFVAERQVERVGVHGAGPLLDRDLAGREHRPATPVASFRSAAE